VQVWAVLPDRLDPWRQDGSKRFYRLIFVSPNLGRLKVKSERLCEVVHLFHNLQTSLGSDPPTTRVGRECDATVMGLGRFATTEGRTWHWDRLGVSAVPPDIRVTSPVRIALIDSGIRPDLATTLGSVAAGSFTSGPFATNNGPQYHAHGTFMATYLRHLAPQVDLRSYRAIDKQGVVTTASLGLAFDTALYDTTDPLIINLSRAIAHLRAIDQAQRRRDLPDSRGRDQRAAALPALSLAPDRSHAATGHHFFGRRKPRRADRRCIALTASPPTRLPAASKRSRSAWRPTSSPLRSTTSTPAAGSPAR
jgi:hypothetical protein